MYQHQAIEMIGWIGTGLLVVSYLMTKRMTLHVIALVSTVLKLGYCFAHDVWPLFVNWLILVFVHVWKLYNLVKEKRLQK